MPQPQNFETQVGRGIGNRRAKQMYEYTLRNGGGTFTADGSILSPRTGFALSLDPGRRQVIPLHSFGPTTLAVFAANHHGYISEYNSGELEPLRGLKGIGTEVQGDTVVLDVTTVVSSRDFDAVFSLAREHGGAAVYDFLTGQEIPVL